jgi:hypothetical protein
VREQGAVTALLRAAATHLSRRRVVRNMLLHVEGPLALRAGGFSVARAEVLGILFVVLLGRVLELREQLCGGRGSTSQATKNATTKNACGPHPAQVTVGRTQRRSLWAAPRAGHCGPHPEQVTVGRTQLQSRSLWAAPPQGTAVTGGHAGRQAGRQAGRRAGRQGGVIAKKK